QYDHEFLKNGTAISASLPLSETPYRAKELFPFFKGLLPEGWYLQIVSMTQKIDENDHFGLLLASTNTDTIGAVTVLKTE
ncbi:MAG: HipA N-terminal domain-containing protein, partial [Pseudomonadota bacterium]